jgi:hypothetical protein
MQQQPQQNYNELMLALNPMVRQLERLEERTRDLATRSDLEALRKELVARDAFEPQMNALKLQIAKLDEDRRTDKAALEEKIKKVEEDQLSRQDRLWMRLGQALAVAAFALTLFQYLTHFKFIP